MGELCKGKSARDNRVQTNQNNTLWRGGGDDARFPVRDANAKALRSLPLRHHQAVAHDTGDVRTARPMEEHFAGKARREAPDRLVFRAAALGEHLAPHHEARGAVEHDNGLDGYDTEVPGWKGS